MKLSVAVSLVEKRVAEVKDGNKLNPYQIEVMLISEGAAYIYEQIYNQAKLVQIGAISPIISDLYKKYKVQIFNNIALIPKGLIDTLPGGGIRAVYFEDCDNCKHLLQPMNESDAAINCDLMYPSQGFIQRSGELELINVQDAQNIHITMATLFVDDSVDCDVEYNLPEEFVAPVIDRVVAKFLNQKMVENLK